MLKKIAIAAVVSSPAYAADVTITGNVEAKCIVQTDTAGVYGNPTPNELTTASASGGVPPIVRFDVAVANYYIAKITYPTSFSTSPNLTDVVNWTGSIATEQVSDAGMSGYDAAAVSYNATKEFELTIAGSTWFEIESAAEYGYGKSFPAGTYRAVVVAECIAQ